MKQFTNSKWVLVYSVILLAVLAAGYGLGFPSGNMR